MRVLVQDHRKAQGMRPVLNAFDFLVPYVDLYDIGQMREVFLGIVGYQKKGDVETYCDPTYTAEQMHQARLAIEQGIDRRLVAEMLKHNADWYVLYRLRISHKKNQVTARHGVKFLRVEQFR